MTLLAPAFLLGLLAIGLPLWLHRFARETQNRRPFASLMLLEASQQHHSRRHTLKYLLLLALRIGLLAALVLAFSEPVMRAAAAIIGTQGSLLNVVVLDTSLSMQYGDRWQRALDRAREVISNVGSRDRVMLVAADHRIRIIHDPVEGGARQTVLGALSSVKPGLTRLDYGMLMTSSESWIDTPGTAARLHLITDLQQSASPLRFADLSPPPGVELNLIDVGDGDTANLFVERVQFSRQDLDALEARIGGRQAENQQREVVLTIDGVERARKVLPPSDQPVQRVLFPGLGLEPGIHRAVVSLEPRDGLPQDDQFFTTLERVEPRVLLVAGNADADDAMYLAAAISSLTSPRLAVERVTPSAIADRPLASYAAVVVSDAGILSEGPARTLTQYLESGGSVLMTLGARAASARTVPVSGHEVSKGAVSAQSAERAVRVAVLEESHPVLRETQGWRSIRFFRYVPVQARDGDAVLIRFENGPPLLLERRMGDGRLLLLTSPLSRDWNDLAIHPVFVRFVGEAAAYLTNAGANNATAIVGSPLTAGLKGRTGAQIYDPRGSRVLNLGDTVSAVRLIPEMPGFYEVRGSGRVDWIGVNIDSREADLARMSPENIQRWQALRSPPRQDPQVAAAGQEPEPLVPVWFWVLMAAVALAFLEPLVANYHLHVRREVQS